MTRIVSTKRLRILDDVERLLLVWINEKQLRGDSVNDDVSCEKAKAIFADLDKKSSMARIINGRRNLREAAAAREEPASTSLYGTLKQQAPT
ncbi:hypothetical protein AVEN_121212-1 [Araneus ventricosus]|uniref:HTH CENPB-type domain-containing protein n=1 Tax=Araneus ventricosus TaxID=182803 RepID=A0A4Y2MDY3_ARAVE|nr:hypothetical protein AVEN_121212-1 [Araneus ventricosus]